MKSNTELYFAGDKYRGEGVKLLKSLLNSKQLYNETARIYDGLLKVDGEDLVKLQKMLLEIYDDLYDVCNKHNITLYLCGGSALGAIRHHGFIPWDDDLDLAMTRADYEKFKTVFKKELEDKYILNAPDYSKHVKSRFPIVIRKGTIYQEIIHPSDRDLQGIKVDIFLIENVPNNRFYRALKGYCCNMLEFIAGQVQLINWMDCTSQNFLKCSGKMDYYARKLIGAFFSFRSGDDWLKSVDIHVRCGDENSLNCALATGRKHYFGEILSRNVFFPPQKMNFAGRQCNVFHDLDAYLTNLYGDYMTIPPVEKRERHLIRHLDFGDYD